ncbi:hypothetical protein KOR34_42000 [Posidoniimonas corsicana]|uniref:Uncharacterized protein n=1 Tax=Posidoniimonas corsicana TaxID=1938618 RepID=A0A5C5V3V2_9BACT|nr:hypothetical protein [Posidoniimonas corsicana]TWT32437.1 hypothetical protein KOR34_42000 [Posidoniimonas corsicana]
MSPAFSPHSVRLAADLVKAVLLLAVLLASGLLGGASARANRVESSTDVECLEVELAVCEGARRRPCRRTPSADPLRVGSLTDLRFACRHAAFGRPALGEHLHRNGLGAPLRC